MVYYGRKTNKISQQTWNFPSAVIDTINVKQNYCFVDLFSSENKMEGNDQWMATKVYILYVTFMLQLLSLTTIYFPQTHPSFTFLPM